MTLSQAKMYGGIGAILALVGGVVPRLGSALSIVGIVLILLAVKEISNETGDEAIFKNYLISFILQIGAFLALIIAIIAVLGTSIIAMGGPRAFEHEMQNFGAIMAIIGSILVGFVIFWIMFSLGSYYLKKSYELIAEHTDVDLFKTTGLLYFIGALTAIILIGLLIIFVARILEIVAYFSLPEELPSKQNSVIV
ncbi:DUF996 domain-containing protein [Thermococcus barophilus]|uniref:DUF996 domain-containing protein n=1 Tax=Thermococcus barophilus (strain DSM 11836 / MP) TaxID=391623 RepID=F0LKC7_THEBM|nr:DUF996 domain-containing protein [Thermococcus barophilus]ADT83585.1 hypothetical protein TERMP_00608 [Thermococcus barophilus MP]